MPAPDGGAFALDSGFITKYSPTGGVDYNAPYNLFERDLAGFPESIAPCSTGVYVAGYAPYPRNGLSLLKFDLSGNLQFTKCLAADTVTAAIAETTPATTSLADSMDNVYVSYGGYLVKYDSSGNILWKGGPTADSMKFDNDGNLVVDFTGSTQSGAAKISPDGQVI